MKYLLVFNPLTLFIIYIAYAWLYTRQSNAFYGFLFLITKWVGAIIDLVVNITWMTVIFWQIPRTWLLTQRVQENKSLGGKRGWLATMICNLLNYFLPKHCK